MRRDDSMKKELSQEQIDAVFSGRRGDSDRESRDAEVSAFDLSHLDRIPKSQLRALHMVHENFVRNLASSLSAYLRSYVALNLVSLEQISYAEFMDGLSFPTGIAYIGLSPYDGTAVLEMSLSLMFTFMEVLMGSKGRTGGVIPRKITDIEKAIMQTLLRVILVDLREAWLSVAEIDFTVQSLASEPQLMHVLAPAEAVIVIAVDVRVGEVTGLMNLAIPSIFIRRLRNRFEQLQRVKKAHSSEGDHVIVAEILQDVSLTLKVYLEGGKIAARTLMDLEEDDILVLDHGADKPMKASLNGEPKWEGYIASVGENLAFEVSEVADTVPL
jgi:flagellar motor switch protein FliM